MPKFRISYPSLSQSSFSHHLGGVALQIASSIPKRKHNGREVVLIMKKRATL
jgi:hypothetical protein